MRDICQGGKGCYSRFGASVAFAASDRQLARMTAALPVNLQQQKFLWADHYSRSVPEADFWALSLSALHNRDRRCGLNQNNRLIITIVDIPRCGWLVSEVAVVDAARTIGFRRSVYARAWQWRIWAEGAGERRHIIGHLWRDNLVRRNVLLAHCTTTLSSLQVSSPTPPPQCYPRKKQPTEMPISDNTAAFGSLGPPARVRSRRNKVRWSVPPCAEGERSRGESRAIQQYIDPRRAVGEQTRPPNRRWARDRVGRIDTNKDPDAAIRKTPLRAHVLAVKIACREPY